MSFGFGLCLVNRTAIVAAVAATLDLQLAGAASLDSRITFSRASNATMVNSAGFVEYAPHNLITQSNDFSAGAFQAVVTPNAATDPFGLVNASLVVDTASSGEHFVDRNYSVVLGNTYTISAYFQADGSNKTAYLRAAGAGAAGVIFNTTTGVVLTAPGSPTAVSVVSAGSGWWRAQVSYVATATSASAIFRCQIATSTGTAVYAGNGTGYYVYGRQVNAGTMQPYFATGASVYYGPRLVYAPVTLAAQGLLIEEQRTNSVLYSEQFDNAAWTKAAATVTANAAISPSGTMSGDALVATGGTFARAQQSIVLGVGTHTLSVYAKAGNIDFMSGTLETTGQILRIFANLSTGAITQTTEAGTIAATSTSVSTGDGWRRTTWIVSVPTAATYTLFFAVSNAYGSFTATAGNTIYLWGAQLEAGAFGTSYIPTAAAQTTRAADIASITGANFSSWYNQPEGTLVVAWTQYAVPVISTRVITVDSGTASNSLQVQSSSTNRVGLLDVASANVFTYASTAVTANVRSKMAIATKSDGSTVALDNVVLGTSTATYTPAAMTTMRIGSGVAATQQINGTIATITYYPVCLNSYAVQALTRP